MLPCLHRRYKAYLEFMPRNLEKWYDYIQGDKKMIETLEISPQRRQMKDQYCDLRKQLNRRGGTKPNAIRTSTEQINQKISSSCLTD